MILQFSLVSKKVFDARESVKDFKGFFYPYSEFHVFIRQPSVENCY